MSWVDFYLLCFAVGFAFSLFSFLLGGLHWHLPFHFHVHGGAAHTPAHAPGYAAHKHAISPFNPVTIAAFLAWFGGAGYLLTRHSGMVSMLILAAAAVAGFIGAGIVFLFLAKVLTWEDEHLDPADFDMIGVLGRISIPVRQSGTGEIIYSQAGTRRTCGARAEQDCAITKGTEVVVTRYEKGIAYVRLWSELAGENSENDASLISSKITSPKTNGGTQ
jgi:membrane protein implicated in regulation of membrane protease activity